MCAKMDALFRQPEQQVDEMGVDVVDPFLDFTDLGTIDSVVEMRIPTGMYRDEMHHVVFS